MSFSWSDSDSSLDELASVCLLSQCLGCSLCQNSEFLTASRLIEELKKKIKDAEEEIEHLIRLRQVRWASQDNTQPENVGECGPQSHGSSTQRHETQGTAGVVRAGVSSDRGTTNSAP